MVLSGGGPTVNFDRVPTKQGGVESDFSSLVLYFSESILSTPDREIEIKCEIEIAKRGGIQNLQNECVPTKRAPPAKYEPESTPPRSIIKNYVVLRNQKDSTYIQEM